MHCIKYDWTKRKGRQSRLIFRLLGYAYRKWTIHFTEQSQTTTKFNAHRKNKCCERQTNTPPATSTKYLSPVAKRGIVLLYFEVSGIEPCLRWLKYFQFIPAAVCFLSHFTYYDTHTCCWIQSVVLIYDSIELFSSFTNFSWFACQQLWSLSITPTQLLHEDEWSQHILRRLFSWMSVGPPCWRSWVRNLAGPTLKGL